MPDRSVRGHATEKPLVTTLVSMLLAAMALGVPRSGLGAVPSLSDAVIHERDGLPPSLSACRGRWVRINDWAT